MAFKDFSAHERITAVHIDFMRDPDFCLLGGTTQIGKVEIRSDVPTAGTDGRDVFYGEAFIMGMTRGQLRYLVAHETLHKMLHHCTEYKTVCDKYPQGSNMAMDYVVNQFIEDLDAGRGFVERPKEPAPLIDPKYRGMSFLEVLRDLLQQSKQQKPQPKPGQGQGQGQGENLPGPMDEHIQQAAPGSGEPGAMTEAEAGTLSKQLQDAINQGKILQTKLREKARGAGNTGADLSGMEERRTDWRKPLRKFISELVEGDDMSRYAPPNRRMLPLGITLPSHFSESTGPLVVACDTSGSLSGVYSVLMGEIARICRTVTPESVIVIWWSDSVEGVQTFAPKDYPSLGKLIKPKGGGGTNLSCVAAWVKAHKVKVKATVIITDGYIEQTPALPPGPLLWGVIDNSSYTPPRGAALHINSVSL